MDLFSDSLSWAINEGKDSCVMVMDVAAYFECIREFYGRADFVGYGPCQYIGRELFEENPGPDSTSEFILRKLEQVAFLKPRDYAPQRELRGLWGTPSGEPAEADILKIPALIDLVIPIDISQVDFSLLRTSNYAIGVRVHLKSTPPAEFEYLFPANHASPVIFRENGGAKRIGFKQQGKRGMVLCVNPLHEVRSIEYYQRRALRRAN